MVGLNIRTIARAGVFAGLTLVAGVPAGWATDLKDSIERTVATNPEIGVARAQRRAADQEIPQAVAGYLPQLDLRGFAGYQRTDSSTTRSRSSRSPGEDGDVDKFAREGTIGLTQLLFDGFVTPARIARARVLADVAAYSTHRTTEIVGLSGVERHLDTLRQQELLRLAEANAQVHRTYMVLVSQRVASGRGRMVDQVQTEGRLAQAEASVIQSRGQLTDALSRYRRVVGEEAADLVRPEPPTSHVPERLDEALARAQRQNPALPAAAGQVAASRENVTAAQGAFYPRIALEGGATRGGDTGGEDGSVTNDTALLTARHNFYRGGSDLATIRGERARVEAAQYSEDAARRAVADDVRVTHNAWMTARARLVELRRYVRATEQVRDAYIQQYNLGQRSLLDLLDIENELFNARSSYVTGEFVELFAQYQTLTAMGELLPVLGIPLPEEARPATR